MLLLQVTVHLILVLPYGMTYLINILEPSTQTSTAMAMRLAFVTWQQCDYFLSFFLYVLSGSVYREQLVQIFKSLKLSQNDQRQMSQRMRWMHPHVPHTNRSLINGPSSTRLSHSNL